LSGQYLVPNPNLNSFGYPNYSGYNNIQQGYPNSNVIMQPFTQNQAVTPTNDTLMLLQQLQQLSKYLPLQNTSNNSAPKNDPRTIKKDT